MTRSTVLLISLLAVGSAGATFADPPEVTAFTLAPESPIPAGTEVTLTAVAADPEGDALSYRFTFGDGTPRTGWLPGQSSIAHVYAQPGVFTALVQVRDPGLSVAARTTTMVVYAPVAPGTPTRSTTVLSDAARGRIWTANVDHDSISSFDLDLGDRVEVAVCDEPRGLSLDGLGRIWVPCRASDSIALVDAASGTLLETLELDYGAAPVAAVTAPDGAAVWVAERGGRRVVRWHVGTLLPTAMVATGPDPGGLAMTPDGATLLVTRFVSEAGAGTVHRIATATAGPAIPIPLTLDTTSPDSGTAGRGLPNALAGIAISPDGARAHLVGKKDNVLRGQYREGTNLNFETTTRTLVAELDLGASTELVARRIDIDDQSMPAAIAVAPLGSHLFVPFFGSRRLIVIVASTGAEAVRVDVGLGPDGVAIDPVTRRVYVHSGLDRSIRSFDGAALLDLGTTVLPEIASVPTVGVEVLPAQVYAGKRLFSDARDPRISQEGYLSCASCHFDGGRDGQVWDLTQFGEGLRETTTLHGVGRLGRGLLHWSGNFDESQDFETPIREHFGGTGLMSDTQYALSAEPLGLPKRGRSVDLDALAAYVDSLVAVERSPDRAPDGSATPDAVEGRLIFAAAGCLDCHSGPSFTDSSRGFRHDIGTIGPGSGGRLGEPLDGLDTPTLAGLWATAPYLHDGSAATLEEVVTSRNPADEHGTTSTLSPAEVGQLVAFLRQIDGSEPTFPGPGDLLFADGFASGDLSAWSSGAP